MSIISCDFDNCLCLDSWPDLKNGKPNVKLIRYLTEARKHGHKIILDTMREGDLLDEAIMWCMDRGIVFDAINDNLPEMVEKWGYNSRKIYGDYIIDDHNAICGIGKKLPKLKRKVKT